MGVGAVWASCKLVPTVVILGLGTGIVAGLCTGLLALCLGGLISSMTVPSGESSTQSPATGLMPLLRKIPRALHSLMPSGVFT